MQIGQSRQYIWFTNGINKKSHLPCGSVRKIEPLYIATEVSFKFCNCDPFILYVASALYRKFGNTVAFRSLLYIQYGKGCWFIKLKL